MARHLTFQERAIDLFAAGYGWEDAFVRLTARFPSLRPKLRAVVHDLWREHHRSRKAVAA